MAAMTAMIAAGVGMSVVSAYQQSEAAKQQGEFQKEQADMNSRLAEMNAEDAVRRGEKAVQQHAQKVKQVVGSQRASMAAQGLDINSGSAMDLQNQALEFGAEDQMTIRNNAWREAWGYKVEAKQSAAQGRLAAMSAGNESSNSLMTGGLRALDYASKFGGTSGEDRPVRAAKLRTAAGGSYKNYNNIA